MAVAPAGFDMPQSALRPASRVGFVLLFKFLVLFGSVTAVKNTISVLSYLLAEILFLATIPLFEELSRF